LFYKNILIIYSYCNNGLIYLHYIYKLKTSKNYIILSLFDCQQRESSKNSFSKTIA
jgi:hypothetical protein